MLRPQAQAEPRSIPGCPIIPCILPASDADVSLVADTSGVLRPETSRCYEDVEIRALPALSTIMQNDADTQETAVGRASSVKGSICCGAAKVEPS